jgi:hypothetical protein
LKLVLRKGKKWFNSLLSNSELNFGVQVLFSDAVFKFVDQTEVETRHFVVTPQGLLDFPPGQYLQVSAVLQFQDITDVLVARKSFEVVLQISDSVDCTFTQSLNVFFSELDRCFLNC